MTLSPSFDRTARTPFFRRRSLIAVALAIVAMGVYANSVGNGFALDDTYIIRDNDAIHSIDNLPSSMVGTYWSFGPRKSALYRPLTIASYVIGWNVWHGDPHGFHAVNVALHGLVTVLVFLLLLQLGAPLAAAVGGALLFALHPVHTEAVANVVGRAELLAALFFVGAAVEYLDVRLARWRRAVVVGLALFLALASKENAATLPGVLVLLELARRDRKGMPLLERMRREWPVMLSVVVAFAGFAALRHHVLGVFLGNDTAPYLAVLPGWERVLTAIRLFPEYVRLAVFPRDLIAEYGPAVIMPVRVPTAMFILGVLLAILAVVVVVVAWKRQRLFSVGVMWFALVMVPVSNLFVAVGVMMAERTLYLPSVGWSIVAAGLVVEVARNSQPSHRRVFATVGLLAAVVAGWWTWQRNPVWDTTDTLLTDLAMHHPESFRAEWYVALRFSGVGNAEKSLKYYRQAIAWVGPHYPLLFSYATALAKFHRYDEAIPLLQRLVKRAPRFKDAQALLGATLAMQNRWQEARDAMEAAVEVNPDDARLYSVLAVADARLGRWRDALKARLTNLQHAGDKVTMGDYIQLAFIRGRMGDMKKANEALGQARELANDSSAVPDLPKLLAAEHGPGVGVILAR
jgi:hypothetical protein